MQKNAFLQLTLITILTTACTPNQVGKQGDFYTWVDERGQLHTIKREKKNSEISLSTGSAQKSKSTEKNTAKTNTFNPSEFTPSEKIDEKLKGQRLYSWNDEYGQNTQEVLPPIKSLEEPQSKKPARPYTAKSFRDYREGKEIFLSELIGRQLKLENLYTFNEATKSDYILFELDLDGEFITDQFTFKSFVSKSRVALPNIVFLDTEYNSVSAQYLPFEDYSEETWSSYAYFSGNALIPKKSKYLLVTPNTEAGVAEIGSTIIKMVDLGSIVIDL